jgi:RND family efflux transporter MFP subunit
VHNHDHNHGHSHDHGRNGESSHNHSHGGGNNGGHSHNEAAHNPDEIIFTRAQAEAAGLKIETIVPRPFSSVIKTGGQIQAAQGDEAAIAATANGIISFVNPSIAEGVYVAAGEAILTISAANLPDGDPALKARLAYETALAEMTRAEGLAGSQIISVKEYEQIRLRYETARTAYEAQADRATAAGITVVAPKGGYMANISAANGEYVQVGRTIATVSQNRRLQLRAEVPERYFGELKNISGANFKTASGNRLYKLSEMGGRLVSFGRTATGGEACFIPIVFEFDRQEDILPGSFVEAYLMSATQENAITVPAPAVTEEQGLHFVYIQVDDEGYRKQEVKLGPDNGERALALTGVKPGDRVVVSAAYQVKLAATASIVPEGHTH